MTQRYGLSDDQAAKLRAILQDEQQKTEAMLKDGSLSPPDRFAKMIYLREDETTRVSAILNPEQQKKYQSDVKQQTQGPPSQPPDGFPPPPPGLQGGGPSAS